MKNLLLGPVLALCFLGVPAVVYGCRCSTPPTSKAYKAAFLVVRATAVSIEQLPDTQQVATLRVSNVWKGAVASEIRVLAGGEECGHFFGENQEYIIYLFREKDGSYSTRNCVGNKFFDDPKLPASFARMAKRDVAWLNRHGKAGKVG